MDPKYFPSAMNEIEDSLAETRKEKEKTIDLDSSMYKIISSLSNLRPNRVQKRIRISLNKKSKRKRPERPALKPLKTKLKLTPSLGQ